jgi:hypothetical protein
MKKKCYFSSNVLYGSTQYRGGGGGGFNNYIIIKTEVHQIQDTQKFNHLLQIHVE